MQGEKVNGRVATWVAGVVGVWAGVAALAALVAALMSPHWALVREPMVLAESPAHDTWFRGSERQESYRPVVTTITFRLGLWTACPRINTTAIHFLVASPPCSSVSYSWHRVSHRDLHLPAPAPLLQTVMARMRLSTPFLVGACGLLGAACLLAMLSRCCFAHAALLAALLYSLAGLSVGVGVVWFVSVVSEEYGIASGRRTSWAALYAYRYGWSLMAAGGAGVAALLAALLTGHAHLARHAPLVGGMRSRASSTEESLARPLLRCRSEGCLGQRSFTSDTIRTYLTCDSRRPPPRGGLPPPPPPLHHCPSLVDLTRPHHQPSAPPDSRRSSRATILGDDLIHDHHLHLHHHHHQQQQQQAKQPPAQQGQQQQQQQEGRGWPLETSRVIIETPRGGAVTPGVPPPPLSSTPRGGAVTPGVPPPPLSSTPRGGAVTPVVPPPPLSSTPRGDAVTPVVPPPPLSSSSSSTSPLEPPPPTGRGGGSRRATEGDPLQRLPEYNSFTGGASYSRTLPTEGRQMAVLGRRSGGRSATLTRPTTKVSSQV